MRIVISNLIFFLFTDYDYRFGIFKLHGNDTIAEVHIAKTTTTTTTKEKQKKNKDKHITFRIQSGIFKL